ncbi:unnamed protein product, partial [Mesorhabditis spiculigera]
MLRYLVAGACLTLTLAAANGVAEEKYTCTTCHDRAYWNKDYGCQEASWLFSPQNGIKACPIYPAITRMAKLCHQPCTFAMRLPKDSKNRAIFAHRGVRALGCEDMYAHWEHLTEPHIRKHKYCILVGGDTEKELRCRCEPRYCNQVIEEWSEGHLLSFQNGTLKGDYLEYLFLNQNQLDAKIGTRPKPFKVTIPQREPKSLVNTTTSPAENSGTLHLENITFSTPLEATTVTLEAENTNSDGLQTTQKAIVFGKMNSETNRSFSTTEASDSKDSETLQTTSVSTVPIKIDSEEIRAFSTTVASDLKDSEGLQTTDPPTVRRNPTYAEDSTTIYPDHNDSEVPQTTVAPTVRRNPNENEDSTTVDPNYDDSEKLQTTPKPTVPGKIDSEEITTFPTEAEQQDGFLPKASTTDATIHTPLPVYVLPADRELAEFVEGPEEKVDEILDRLTSDPSTPEPTKVVAWISTEHDDYDDDLLEPEPSEEPWITTLVTIGLLLLLLLLATLIYCVYRSCRRSRNVEVTAEKKQLVRDEIVVEHGTRDGGKVNFLRKTVKPLHTDTPKSRFQLPEPDEELPAKEFDSNPENLRVRATMPELDVSDFTEPPSIFRDAIEPPALLNSDGTENPFLKPFPAAPLSSPEFDESPDPLAVKVVRIERQLPTRLSTRISHFIDTDV